PTLHQTENRSSRAGRVLDPIPDIYGSIEFWYGTWLEPYEHPTTFVIPERPAATSTGFCTSTRG
ncbi:MAG: hypothetical protein ACE5I3_13690, partial [Phycisphaerae bacterium]